MTGLGIREVYLDWGDCLNNSTKLCWLLKVAVQTIFLFYFLFLPVYCLFVDLDFSEFYIEFRSSWAFTRFSALPFPAVLYQDSFIYLHYLSRHCSLYPLLYGWCAYLLDAWNTTLQRQTNKVKTILWDKYQIVVNT